MYLWFLGLCVLEKLSKLTLHKLLKGCFSVIILWIFNGNEEVGAFVSDPHRFQEHRVCSWNWGAVQFYRESLLPQHRKMDKTCVEVTDWDRSADNHLLLCQKNKVLTWHFYSILFLWGMRISVSSNAVLFQSCSNVPLPANREMWN